MEIRKLSKEIFYTDIQIDLDDVYIYKDYVTNGELVLDAKVATYRAYSRKVLPDAAAEQVIENVICKQNLEIVLKKGIPVWIQKASIRDVRLVTNDSNTQSYLLGEKYARQIPEWLYCFYLNDIFYFFEYVPIDEDMEIEEDSYMFVMAVMRCLPNKLDMSKMLKLEEYINKLKI